MRGFAVRTSPTVWICAAGYVYKKSAPLPLILADEPSIFRKIALDALERANHKNWHINYLAPTLVGIKAAVRAGLGIGVLAEMAMLDSDTDLDTLPADHLFPQCTTWIVLRRESVLREYVLEFIAQFAPHLDRRDVVRALAANTVPAEWSAVPHWRERPAVLLPDAA